MFEDPNYKRLSLGPFTKIKRIPCPSGDLNYFPKNAIAALGETITRHNLYCSGAETTLERPYGDRVDSLTFARCQLYRLISRTFAGRYSRNDLGQRICGRRCVRYEEVLQIPLPHPMFVPGIDIDGFPIPDQNDIDDVMRELNKGKAPNFDLLKRASLVLGFHELLLTALPLSMIQRIKLDIEQSTKTQETCYNDGISNECPGRGSMDWETVEEAYNLAGERIEQTPTVRAWKFDLTWDSGLHKFFAIAYRLWLRETVYFFDNLHAIIEAVTRCYPSGTRDFSGKSKIKCAEYTEDLAF